MTERCAVWVKVYAAAVQGLVAGENNANSRAATGSELWVSDIGDIAEALANDAIERSTRLYRDGDQ